MSVLVHNHEQPFRPLRGGTAILTSSIRLFGTLGFVATSDGVDRWLVSAYHVLGGSAPTPVHGEPVFQPAIGPVEQAVATVDAIRADKALDVAAAVVLPGIDAVPEILGLGKIGGATDPFPGMRVVKSGLATGITEGIVIDVQGTRAVIETLPGYPSKYELSSISDSGAAWVEQGTGLVVALHVAGNDTGKEVAIGVPIARVLAALGLQVAV